MNKTKIRIATRQSPLALWQAEFIKSSLEQHHPHLEISLVPMISKGDILLDTPLAKIGGKGLFLKELEVSLLNHEADIAVHSLKDVPVEFPEGLMLHTICERDDPRDAFVSNQYACLEDLPVNAVVGTSSLRRQTQLKSQRPDLIIKDLRGNIGTRLSKLDQGNYDAIILASSGLKRLQLTDRIQSYLSTKQCLPANGQGAICIECRIEDKEIQELLKPLEHQETRYRVLAERAMNAGLEGGCQVPIGSYAEIKNNQLHLEGLVGSLDGQQIIRATIEGEVEDYHQLGTQLAEHLLQLGADKILNQIR